MRRLQNPLEEGVRQPVVLCLASLIQEQAITHDRGHESNLARLNFGLKPARGLAGRTLEPEPH